MNDRSGTGNSAIQEKSHKRRAWQAYRFLVLRRLCQLLILTLFLTAPLLVSLTGESLLISGNLSSSLILGTIPMSDPLAVLQSLLAGHSIALKGLLGATVVILLYGLSGGRSFCSWVCPINPVTDFAAWLRQKLGIRNSHKLPRSSRYWILIMVLVLPLITGMIVWEIFNPVSQTVRGLLFGMGAGWYLIAGIFLFDLLISARGWCGHLCPLGAFYGLLGCISPLQVSATKRKACDDCMDCYAICPEAQILPLALKENKGKSPVLNKRDCSRCGRCIDVCSKHVFEFQTSFSNHLIATTRQTPKRVRDTK